MAGAGADTQYVLTLHLGLLHLEFDVSDPPDLHRAPWKLAEHYRRAVNADDPTAHYLGKVSRAWNRFVSGMK